MQATNAASERVFSAANKIGSKNQRWRMSASNLAHLVFAKCNQHWWSALPAGIVPQLPEQVSSTSQEGTEVSGAAAEGEFTWWDELFEQAKEVSELGL